jgi:hypothetical protein
MGPQLVLLCEGGINIDWGYLKTVLRRIFGPKRDEVTGEWRNLHNGELLDLYS